jgi:adenine-specific DNA-methyltransferase
MTNKQSEPKKPAGVEPHPERVDLRSHDVLGARREELLRLFPEARTEGGKLDLDKLRLALGEAVDVGKERYGMTWPGKADCWKTIQAPSLGTLLPCPAESVAWDSTENLIIEGDNLEALKLLQKSYMGKVKLIYIDPPYNTGNDFIYPDNYSESLQTYLQYTGQVDSEGKRFGTNTDADGRFHSKWLNMMYPRLYLARNLLAGDGVICVSIDDGELHSLRMLMVELFGEENFFGTVAWQKKDTPSNDAQGLSVTHEYIVIYGRTSVVARNLIPRTDEQLANYKNPDSDPRGPWTRTSLIRKELREGRDYKVANAIGRERLPPPGTSWRIPPETFENYVRERRIWWGQDGDGDLPFLKRFLTEVQDGVVPITWWDYEFAGSNRNGKIEIRDLFDGEAPFETPKPSSLIQRLLQIVTDQDSLVLDFFAGSGTTAHAVLEQNRQDNGNRKFILVQLPEPIERGEYKTIADITKERVRRVIKKLDAEDAAKSPTLFDDPPSGDRTNTRGFRVFRLAESSFLPWDADAPKDAATLAQQLQLHVEHIRPGRSADDLVHELLLKTGFPVTTPFEKRELAGKTVYTAAGGSFLLCLDSELTLELIRAIADQKPQRVVCLDHGFAGNDQLKANAVQIFKTKGIEKFLTV